MRPVRLEIQGFTCYRGKQEIDFSRLGLFAIAGPTGAGKSSILDAIAFALYGKIPRMGGQNLDEFISLGAARASVLLDFDMRGERYRVARSMPRSGPKKAQLEQISNGSLKALADGVAEVNARLQALLGLEYEAFIQSVLLPQGDFSRFLKSKPTDQRQILRELLRLGIYERMRERALAQARDISVAMKSDRELLDGPYVDATPHHVALLEKELEGLAKEKEIANRNLANLRRSLETLGALWKLVEERNSRRQSLRRLDHDRPRIEQLRSAIERAKRAANVVPVLDQAAIKAKTCQTAKNEFEGHQRSLEALMTALLGHERKLSGAQKRAEALPAKRSRAMELSSIQPILKERTDLASRRDKVRSDFKKAEEAIAQAEDLLGGAEKTLVVSKENLETLVGERSSLGYDATIYAVFKNSARLAHDLMEARKLVLALNPGIVQTAVRDLATALQKAEKDVDTAQAEHAVAEQHSAAAQAALDAAQDQHKAASLRAHLTPGCWCPVCEQPVNRIPSAAHPPELEKARIAAAKLKKNCEAAAERLASFRDQLSRTRANVENARKNAADWEEQSARYRQRVENYTQSLTAAIKPFECAAGALVDEFVETELARLEKIQAKWLHLGEKINIAGLDAHKVESARDAARMRLATERATKLRLGGEIEEAEKRLAGYDTQIHALGSDDPEKELLSIEKEIDEIDRRLKKTSDDYRRAEAEAHQTELDLSAAKARLSSALKERDECQAAADSALREAGFADDADVRKAVMSAKSVTDGERQLSGFEQNFSQTQTRITELDTQLDGVALTEADVALETEKVRKADELLLELIDRIGKRTEKTEKLKKDTEKAEALRLEHEKRGARYVIFDRLSKDLRGDAFQQYLLLGSFRRLVAGASARLRDLNDRYELTFDDVKFAVIDHDHGSLTRLADTLSGGETFLVSLALALELSEQVQQAAGAVRLDSLFIDEGFGTLDPETLDTVADAIERLSKTNRMVGVITHVAELHRRLPRLEVRPSAAGSTVEYVED